MTVGVGAAVLGIMAVLYSLWWLVNRLIDLAVPQPKRVRQPRVTGPSLDAANDYFTATGAMRLRLHEYRRQLAEQKKAAATFERPAA